VDAVANLSKVCHYLDMPLQHISDPILRRMKRGITTKQTWSLIRRLRGSIRDLAIRTTFIVGFPGETEKEFSELLDFVKDSAFERMGVFTYSQEEGTPASLLENQVPSREKHSRFDRLMSVQQEIARSVNERLVGKELDVMVDEPASSVRDAHTGRSFMDAPEVDGNVFIQAKRGSQVRAGDMMRVRITGARHYDLVADLAA
jgi:ribosomal protein S12 methylthiotransferase